MMKERGRKWHDDASRLLLLSAPLVLTLAVACNSDENEADATRTNPGTAGAAGAGGAGTGGSVAAGGLAPFTPPADPGKGAFLVTVSGEAFALGGFDFTQGTSKSGDPAFVDGWAVTFDHVIVTYAEVRLNEGADTDPADKTKMGKLVASASGPWAVDLARGGPLVGKGGPGEQSVPLAAVKGDFDPTTRYALSYDTAAATATAANVNLDAAAVALYQTAITNGWSVVYTGKAVYRGPTPPAGSVFAKLPTEVHFTFGARSAATMTNCENPELGASAIGEGFARGVQVLPNASSVVQLTWHTDHLFWGALEQEEVPLHFDQFAIRSSGYGAAGATADVTLDDVAGLDFTFFRAKNGDQLPARSAVPDYAAPPGPLGFSSGSVNVPKNDYAEYVRLAVVESSHLNADGECAARPKP